MSDSQGDKLFASMLRNEIEAMSSEYKIVNEKADVAVVDLDGGLFKENVDSHALIGFSRNEDALSASDVKKCHAVLHRPFLLEELDGIFCRIAART